MTEEDRPTEALARIQKSVQLHARGVIFDGELANDVIAAIGNIQDANVRCDLIGSVVPLLPESALRKVEYFCGQILAPGAEWIPASLSRWAYDNRERLIPACRHVAIEFRRQLHQD